MMDCLPSDDEGRPLAASRDLALHEWAGLAVGESSAILLHPTLPAAGVSIGMQTGRQQNDSLADG